MHIVAFCLTVIHSVSPRYYFSVDPETPIDQEFFPSEDQFTTAELPGKQPPLIIQISPIPFSLIFALDFATVVIPVAPILMHSLFL